MITIKDAVEFIMKNRKGKAFSTHTCIEDVIHEVCQAIEQNCFCVATEGEVITGVATGSVIEEPTKVVYITNCLTTTKGSLNTLLKNFRSRYPNYKLEARRKGKIKRYNTERLLNLTNTLTLKGAV